MCNLKKRFCTLALDFPGTIIAHLDTKISLLLCTFIKKNIIYKCLHKQKSSCFTCEFVDLSVGMGEGLCLGVSHCNKEVFSFTCMLYTV